MQMREPLGICDGQKLGRASEKVQYPLFRLLCFYHKGSGILVAWNFDTVMADFKSV